MIEYPYKCRILKQDTPCCECQFPDDVNLEGKALEEFHAAGLWHDKNCDSYGKDVFDQTIEIEFEQQPDFKLVIKKYKWVQQ